MSHWNYLDPAAILGLGIAVLYIWFLCPAARGHLVTEFNLAFLSSTMIKSFCYCSGQDTVFAYYNTGPHFSTEGILHRVGSAIGQIFEQNVRVEHFVIP